MTCSRILHWINYALYEPWNYQRDPLVRFLWWNKVAALKIFILSSTSESTRHTSFRGLNCNLELRSPPSLCFLREIFHFYQKKAIKCDESTRARLVTAGSPPKVPWGHGAVSAGREEACFPRGAVGGPPKCLSAPLLAFESEETQNSALRGRVGRLQPRCWQGWSLHLGSLLTGAAAAPGWETGDGPDLHLKLRVTVKRIAGSKRKCIWGCDQYWPLHFIERSILRFHQRSMRGGSMKQFFKRHLFVHYIKLSRSVNMNLRWNEKWNLQYLSLHFTQKKEDDEEDEECGISNYCSYFTFFWKYYEADGYLWCARSK